MRFKISKNYLIIFLVLVLGLVFLNLFTEASDFLKNLTFKVFSPMQKFFIKTGNELTVFFEVMLSIGELGEENAKLRQKNMEIEAGLTNLKEIEKENISLRQALNFSQKNNPLYEISSVVGKEIQGGGGWILIDKGIRQGVKKDMVIVSEGLSLVGRVFETYEDFSKILLIINPKSVVAVLIENKRSEGLIQKDEGGNKLFMDFVPKEESPEIGEKIITSGMDNIYPRGVLVGEVESVDSSDNQLFNKIIIIPFTDFDKLESVFIIKP